MTLPPAVLEHASAPVRSDFYSWTDADDLVTSVSTIQQARPAFAMNSNLTLKVLLLMASTNLFTVSQAAERTQARSMIISRYGIVATEHPLASQIGATILGQGGNAVDAAVAANAAMGVVEPMANGIGGDLFAIVYEQKSGKLYGLNASGWAPAG